MLIFESKRLRIVEATLDDSQFFYDLLNSENWLQFIGDRGIKTLKDSRDYIQNFLIKSYTDNGFGLYKVILKDHETDIGICGLVKRDELRYPDIGFAILPQFENNGYAFEAAQSILYYAKNRLNLNTIFAITSQDNFRTIKLIEKIGFKFDKPVKLKKDKLKLLLYTNKNYPENKMPQ